MKIVVAVFELDEVNDEKETGHPKGEPGDINEGIPFGFFNVPQCYFEIVFKHCLLNFYLLWFNLSMNNCLANRRTDV